MVRYLIIFLALLFSIYSVAQGKTVFPRWRIGITPSTLIYDVPGIQFSLDKSLNERINLTAEYAPVCASTDIKSGFRFHTGLEIMVVEGRWISYVVGMHYTQVATTTQQKIPTRARNREFSYLSYQDVSNDFKALSISNSVLMNMGNRIYISVGAGVGSGRRIRFAGTAENISVRSTGNSQLVNASAIYYVELNLSYALIL